MIMVAAIATNAIRKTISAIFSRRSDLVSSFVRIDKNEKIQLAINRMADIPVISSMIVAAENFDILIDVNTIRQNPKRLEEVVKICGDFSAGIKQFYTQKYTAIPSVLYKIIKNLVTQL